MKMKEELNALKNEVEALNAKLAELTEEEMETVIGGTAPSLPATQLAEEAYNGMFNGCPNLKSDPGLNAKPF